MRPKFLFDENVSDILWNAVQAYNRFAEVPMDVLRVGEPADLPKGTTDQEMLIWAERNGRIIVSHDKQTLRDFMADHLAAGRHVPGLFLLTYRMTVEGSLELLAVAAQSNDPLEWQDMIEFLG